MQSLQRTCSELSQPSSFTDSWTKDLNRVSTCRRLPTHGEPAGLRLLIQYGDLRALPSTGDSQS